MNILEAAVKQCYVAIDEGTTSVRALGYSLDGHVLASAGRPLGLRNPAARCFEQDGEEILSATDEVLAAVMGDLKGLDVRGLAISNQRESVVACDRRTGVPLTPVIGWQDSRTVEECRSLSEAGWSDRFRRATGLHLDPMYSATKMGLLTRTAASRQAAGNGSDPGTDAAGDAAICTLDSLLVLHLTGGAVYATDPTNACRTLLYDIHTGSWDPALCEAAEVDIHSLPEVRRSSAPFGRYAGRIGALVGVPIRGVMGDSHAALFGQRCEPGTGKVTFGTGSSIMIPTRRAPDDPSPVDTTIGFVHDDAVTYAREGNVLAAGAGVDAAARFFGFGTGIDLVRAAEGADRTRVAYVPAFSGLAAPWWDRDAVGILVGLERHTTAAEVARAVVESVGHQIADIVDVVRSEGTELTVLRADGGLTRSASFVQTMADILDVSIETSDQSDISAYGAARMCAFGLGELNRFDSGEVARARLDPQITESRRAAMRSTWKTSVMRSRGFAVSREGDHR